MRIKALFTIFSMVLSTSAIALDLAKYPMVFETQDSVIVAVAPTVSGDQALVQVKGINHAIDGVVFLTDVVSRNAETRAYNYTRDGKERALVLRQKGWRGEYFEAFLPDQGRVGLVQNQEQAEKIDLHALLALYEQQNKAGIQNDIARFNREGKVAESQEVLNAVDESANKNCNSNFQTIIDWDSIPDDLLIAIQPQGYCGMIANELERMCKDDAAAQELAQGIQKINCQFGDRLKLDRDDTTVYFTTEKDEPNQAEFARNYFRNL